MSQFTAVTPRALPERGSVRSNIIALYALQISNYVLPMLTLPYMIRTLGVADYGLLAIAHASVFFLVLAVDSGIDTRAVRQLAGLENKRRDIELVFASTQWLKLIGAVAAFAILVLLMAGAPQIRAHAPVYAVTFTTVIGSVMFPTWLFQGLELMHVTTKCSVAGRIVATLAIFVFVKGPDDIVLAAFLQASATALSGLFALRYIRRELKLRLVLPSGDVIDATRQLLRETKGLWASEFATHAMSNSGVFVLSLFAGEGVVGVFAAIEKIFRAATSAFQPLLRALFPRVTQRWGDGVEQGMAFASTCMWRIIVLALALSTGMAALAAPGLEILFGTSWTIHAGLLRLFAIAVFIGVLASALGQLNLLARGRTNAYVRTLLAGALVQLAATLAGAAFAGALGMAIALILAESIRALLFSIAAYKFRIKESS